MNMILIITLFFISTVLIFSTSDVFAETYTSSNSTIDGYVRTFVDNTSICSQPQHIIDNSTNLDVALSPTGSNGDCQRVFIEWDISPIPDNAIINKTTFKFEVINAPPSPLIPTCDIYSIENQPSNSSMATLWSDMADGTKYVSASTQCSSSGGNKIIVLGTFANNILQNSLLSDWFGIGITESHDPVRQSQYVFAGIYSQDYNQSYLADFDIPPYVPTPTPTLTVTYTVPPPSSPPTNLITISGDTTVTLSWTAPTNNGASPITDYKVQYLPSPFTGSWITFNDGISNDTGATVTGLQNGQQYNFRVSAINSVGTSVPSNIATATPSPLGFINSFSKLRPPTHPTSVEFSPDGTKMFVTSLAYTDVSEFNCLIAFSVSSCILVDSFSLSSQTTTPNSLEFSTNGTLMFIVGARNAANDKIAAVYQYTLPTPFDLSGASFTSSFLVTYYGISDIGARGLEFNNDGTIMFVSINKYSNVSQFTLSSPYNITSATYVSPPFGIFYSGITGLAFSPDGMNMFIPSNNEKSVLHYALNSSFNVTTVNYVGQYDVSAEETTPRDITFSPNGTKMFVTGFFSHAVNEYNLPNAFSFN